MAGVQRVAGERDYWTKSRRTGDRALHRPCEHKRRIWGESWRVGEKHEWAFFDQQDRSETYARRLTHCPACGRRLERENLRAATYPA